MMAEVRFLPPYSPDLNPIEKMWSKIKQIKAQTQEALLAAIAGALECVSEEDALGWFTSCGYTSN